MGSILSLCDVCQCDVGVRDPLDSACLACNSLDADAWNTVRIVLAPPNSAVPQMGKLTLQG